MNQRETPAYGHNWNKPPPPPEDPDKIKAAAIAVAYKFFKCIACRVKIMPPLYKCVLSDKHMFCANCVRINRPCPVPHRNTHFRCNNLVIQSETFDVVVEKLHNPPKSMAALVRFIEYMLSHKPHFARRIIVHLRMTYAN